MRNLKVIGIIVVVVLSLIVVLQNTEAVNTKILFAEITMPRAALLGTTLGIGFIIGLLTNLGISRKHKPKQGKQAKT